MKRYWQYLRYVLRHKWHVLWACRKLGIFWQGVIHDLSKFRLDEFIPYAKHFYNPDGSCKDVRGKTGYYKPTDTGDPAFDFAWFLHQKRNKHHWQYWIVPEDGGGVKVFPMPQRYLLEVLADWQGAGLAQGRPDTLAWYRKNKDKMQLSPETRKRIEALLGYEERQGE